MIYLAATLIAAAMYGLCRLDAAVHLSPDGGYYLAAARGEATPTPYRLRWLPGLLCGTSAARWQVLSALSLIAWGPALCWYLEEFAPWQRLAGVVLLCGLPGFFRLNVTMPVLVDAPAFLGALVSAGAALHGHPVYAVVAALLAGACKESAPIFAALFCFSGWPLVGLAAVGWWRRSAKTGSKAPEWLSAPWAASLKQHRSAWLNWGVMLLPWGALAPLAALSGITAMIPAVVLGYGQMLRSQDRARLFCWAAPMVIVGALTVLPEAWAVPILLAHVFNPYRGV